MVPDVIDQIVHFRMNVTYIIRYATSICGHISVTINMTPFGSIWMSTGVVKISISTRLHRDHNHFHCYTHL